MREKTLVLDIVKARFLLFKWRDKIVHIFVDSYIFEFFTKCISVRISDRCEVMRQTSLS